MCSDLKEFKGGRRRKVRREQFYRTYFLESDRFAASTAVSADADCTGARIEEDDDEDRGFPLRVSSTRADSATPSLLYLNQHVAERIT